MSGYDPSPITIGWYDGPRVEIRDLFELADESAVQIDRTIGRGRVLVARDRSGTIIAVRAHARGQGVGRRLIEHAVSACRDEHVASLTLITAVADAEVVRFYQRCDFRAYAIERDVFTPANGYPADLEVDGIPVRDAIRFVRVMSD